MIFSILIFFFHSFAENTFPCENVTEIDSCNEIGWCFWNDNSCVNDLCMKLADESTDCGSGCLKAHFYSDTNCETGEEVNFTDFYCRDQDREAAINSCFYESLKYGSCSNRVCQLYSFSGSDYCGEANSNDCHVFGTDYCHLATWCLLSNGECVFDLCAMEAYPGPGHVCKNPECAPHDFYYTTGDNADDMVTYMVATQCVDKKNTNRNTCARISPYTFKQKGNFCYDTVYTPSICTDVSFCRVFDIDPDFFPLQHVCVVVPSNESNESNESNDSNKSGKPNEDDGKEIKGNMWITIGVVFMALTVVSIVVLVVAVAVLLRRKQYSRI